MLQYWEASMRRQLILPSSEATGRLLMHLTPSVAVFRRQQDRPESIKIFMLFLIGLRAVVTAKGSDT